MLDSTRGDETRFYRRLTIALCMVILAGAIVGIIVPAGSGWDFANFFDTGRRMAAGQVLDLYRPDSLIAGEQPQGKLGFYGAPISALLYMPLSLFSPAWALIAFKVQNTIAYFAALGLLYWHNRQFAGNSSTGAAVPDPSNTSHRSSRNEEPAEGLHAHRVDDRGRHHRHPRRHRDPGLPGLHDPFAGD
jgi:hypothetical protein